MEGVTALPRRTDVPEFVALCRRLRGVTGGNDFGVFLILRGLTRIQALSRRPSDTPQARSRATTSLVALQNAAQQAVRARVARASKTYKAILIGTGQSFNVG